MKSTLTLAMVFVGGLALGAGTLRFSGMQAALAQDTSPSPAATSAMPMHSTMPMHPGMGNCNTMSSMMTQAHGTVDRAYMQSMMQMHQDMQSMKWTGNADHDFIVMMIPHHQGAIAMARVELQYGKNSKLLAMARGIITTQGAEIAALKAQKGP